MDITPAFSRTEIAAQDFLTAARAIRANNANTCLLNSDWTKPAPISNGRGVAYGTRTIME